MRKTLKKVVHSLFVTATVDRLIVQGDRNISLHLTITVQDTLHTFDDLTMAFKEYIQNVTVLY
jgi:hypothetical protein